MTIKNEMAWTDKHGVSKGQLTKALNKFFGNRDILTVFVGEQANVLVAEYDGISITKWCIDNAFDFIDAMAVGYRYEGRYEIVSML